MATENINAIYDLEKWVGFYEQVIKRYSNIDPSYNANSQYDQFYMGKIFYNPKEVNKDNVKIYLINKETNEEVRMNQTYSYKRSKYKLNWHP